MKNLFLSAAMLLAFAANAQTETGSTTALSNTTATTASVDQEKEYKKIEQSQIAPDVLKQAVAKYKDYSLVEALASTDGTEYKLVLTKDGKDVTALYKSNGEFIKEVTV
ncbi:hypothetical protein [Flavobacterium cerinum]|uniref:Beta-lactamase-inhibitor-like PepSY-like domain-containing protein n=1 Tax=Flavobacterium cerinum TaxID=2502784 RepID=A0A3S3QKN6_9FLAO|nr:hypothetical protein [Flavobacterium cerinum]RWW99942.1 hypothetical protein EPI11_10370 [Flavobacterium cerinum]